MSTGYEPNIEGALAVLVDLMEGNGFTMTRSPYAPNYRGLVDALIDLKDGFPTFAPFRVGFNATTFQAVNQGQALYMRSSDGLVGAAIASGTLDQAYVVGIADTTKGSGEVVKVLVKQVLQSVCFTKLIYSYINDGLTSGVITVAQPVNPELSI